MRNLLILLLFVLSTFTTVFSQVPPHPGPGGMANMPKNGVIKGKIVDAESKAPMEYANVAIYSKRDSSLVSGGIADTQGTFQITDLPFGAYYVEAQFIGFQKTRIKDIKIIPNAQTVDLGTLELKADSKTLGTVDVVAEKNRVEYKIDKKVINVSQDINAAGGNAATVLENTPSVEVDIDGNVSLRGSSNFTVLIDGRPSVLAGNDALKQIPSSVIENIEIITNPSVKYDPDGMAGIINIVMKKNILSGLNGIINVNVGTGEKYGTDLTMNYKTKKFNFLVGGNWNDNTDKGTQRSIRETYQNDTTTYLSTRGKRNQSRGGQQLRTGFDYFITKKTSITVLGEVGKYNFNADGGGNIHQYREPSLPGSDTYSVQSNNSLRDGNFVSANAGFLTKFDGTGMHKLEGSFEYRNRRGNASENIDEVLSDAFYHPSDNYLSRVQTSENDNSDDYRMKLDYTLPLKGGAKFEAGAQSRLEGETEMFGFKNYDPATGTFINNPEFTSDMDFQENIHSIYSTYSGKLSKVEYMVGLRGEYTNRSIAHSKVKEPYKLDRFDVFPSAHFSYQMGEKNQLMTSYSRRINRPDGRDLDPFPNYMNQYTIRIGNPNLKPEYTDSYELSYMRRLAGSSFISFETFYRTTNDLMSRVQEVRDNVTYMSMDNLNRDHSTGGELMANINFTRWLLVNTSFTLYNYQLKGTLMGVSVDRQSTNYSGRMNATVKVSPESRFQLTGFYRGPSANAQGSQKGMMFTNFSYRQDFMKKKLTATLSLRDVFGTGKYEGTNIGQSFRSTFRMQREPRVLMLTLSYKINNYKMERESQQEQPSQGGGGEDMF
ncbi:MAG: TonB-dependent receptor domain-containing protein [Candidatus Saccharibacteria bacterium]